LEAVARDEKVEVAHEAPAQLGIKAIDQANSPFKQERFDADPVEAGGSWPSWQCNVWLRRVFSALTKSR
jgi:hypothetical protein